MSGEPVPDPGVNTSANAPAVKKRKQASIATTRPNFLLIFFSPTIIAMVIASTALYSYLLEF
jgi:hypothetical protein